MWLLNNCLEPFGTLQPKLNEKLAPRWDQKRIGGFSWPKVRMFFKSLGVSYSTGWKERVESCT